MFYSKIVDQIRLRFSQVCDLVFKHSSDTYRKYNCDYLSLKGQFYYVYQFHYRISTTDCMKSG